MAVVAQYHGQCAECEQTIVPGQQIETVDDEWQHVDCGSLPERVVCVCEKCFLVHAPMQPGCA